MPKGSSEPRLKIDPPSADLNLSGEIVKRLTENRR